MPCIVCPPPNAYTARALSPPTMIHIRCELTVIIQFMTSPDSYAMLCYAMLCYATLRYAMRQATLRYATLHYAMLCYAMLCHHSIHTDLIHSKHAPLLPSSSTLLSTLPGEGTTHHRVPCLLPLHCYPVRVCNSPPSTASPVPSFVLKNPGPNWMAHKLSFHLQHYSCHVKLCGTR